MAPVVTKEECYLAGFCLLMQMFRLLFKEQFIQWVPLWKERSCISCWNDDFH